MRFGKKKKMTLMDQATEMAGSALESLESAFESAKETAGPMLSDARERATPLIDQGRVLAIAKAAEGRAIAAEKAALAAERAAIAAAVARERAPELRALAAEQAAAGRMLAAAKLAQLRREEPLPEPEPEPRSRFRTFLLITGLLAIGGFVAKMLRDRQADDNWESAYVPPAPVSTPTPSPADNLANPLTDPLPGQATDDPGGAGPDEAMSDAVDAPHPITTPDDPAHVVDVDADHNR